jgi:F-type H+-transporting ATPase subunit a
MNAFLALLAAATPEAAPAVEHAAPALAQAAHTAAESAGHAAGGHGQTPGEILMHHVTDQRIGHLMVGGVDLGPTWHLVFFAGVALLVLVLVRLALRQYDAKGTPRGFAAFVETLVVFIRDEVAIKNIGHDGIKYVPLLLSFFFFIFTAALVGLLPYSKTSTGNVSVTVALALVSFLTAQWAGISKYGFVHHFVGLVPASVPGPLKPLMFVIELLSLFAKPFALTVRLFANMVAGHIVITTLLMLIPLMAAVSHAMGLIMIPVSLALALFIMALELLVAFLQAFIFTLLSSIFIGMAAHPSH